VIMNRRRTHTVGAGFSRRVPRSGIFGDELRHFLRLRPIGLALRERTRRLKPAPTGGREFSTCFLMLVLMTIFAVQAPLSAQSTDSAPAAPTLDLELLSRGKPFSPLLWKAYRQIPIPPVNSSNGPMVSGHIRQGKLDLSLTEFLHLVVENNLTLEAARYNYMISQVDVLRARSGQAARGVPGVPVPGALFAGAIGAGVGSTASVSTNGTGGTTISGTAREVFGGARGTAEPTLSINTSWDRVVNPLNSIKVAGVSTVAIPSTVLQTRWQQELPFGTSYSIDFNMQRQSTTQRNILYSPAYTSFFSLHVYQPLLNGFGRSFTHRFMNLAENDRKIAYEQFSGSLSSTLSDAANTYWDFVAFRERQGVAERALALAQTIYQTTQERIDLGVLARSELITAASRVATSRRDLIIAQTNVQLQEVKVKSLITKVIGPEIDRVSFQPTDSLDQTLEITFPPFDETLRGALRKPGVQIAELNLDNQRIAETFTRSNLRPTFSVFAEFNSHTLAPGLGGMFGQMWEYAYPEFAAGFSLSFSVKNRAAQADNVRSRLELQQAQVALDQAKANSVINVRTSMTNLTPSRSQLEAAQRAVAASQETADGEQARWNEGYSTLEKVYQAQTDLVSAQIAEIQSSVNYAKAVVAAQGAAGTFLPSHGLAFEDALKGSLWKGPALK
jgi:outer membrane protein TolC